MTTLAILAGGESRRMGRDKARLELGGATLLERIASTAREFGPVAVVGRTDSEHFDLPELDFLPDRVPGLGPLGGLRTALEKLDGPVLALGCDMPLVDTDAIEWLVDAFETRAPETGLVPRTERGLQPLFALYTTAVAPTIEQMLDDGERSLHRLVERARIPTLDAPPSVAARLVNVNTPEDWQELLDSF